MITIPFGAGWGWELSCHSKCRHVLLFSAGPEPLQVSLSRQYTSWVLVVEKRLNQPAVFLLSLHLALHHTGACTSLAFGSSAVQLSCSFLTSSALLALPSVQGTFSLYFSLLS